MLDITLLRRDLDGGALRVAREHGVRGVDHRGGRHPSRLRFPVGKPGFFRRLRRRLRRRLALPICCVYRDVAVDRGLAGNPVALWNVMDVANFDFGFCLWR